MNELVRVTAPGGRIIVVTWCHRELKAGETDLSPKENSLLDKINDGILYNSTALLFTPPPIDRAEIYPKTSLLSLSHTHTHTNTNTYSVLPPKVGTGISLCRNCKASRLRRHSTR